MSSLTFDSFSGDKVHSVGILRKKDKLYVTDDWYTRDVFNELKEERDAWKLSGMFGVEPYRPGNLSNSVKPFNNQLDALQYIEQKYYPKKIAHESDSEILKKLLVEDDYQIPISTRKTLTRKNPSTITVISDSPPKSGKGKLKGFPNLASAGTAGSYQKGASCPKLGQQHSYMNKGSYDKCLKCGSTRSHKSATKLMDM